MTRTWMCFGLLIFSFSIAFADNRAPLPNWIDPQREARIPGARVQRAGGGLPQPEFRIPAEYEPVQAVVLGWAGYENMLSNIARFVLKDTDAEVWALEGPSTLAGNNSARYHSVNCALNSAWIRDYGPYGILEKVHQPAVVDTTYRHYQYRPDDDRAPTCMAQDRHLPAYAMPLIMDGGNFMVDTKGNLFMSKRTYLWNPGKTEAQVNQLLKHYYNVKTINALEYAGYPGEPADGTGHIDMFAKLLSDNTVLIAQPTEQPYKDATDKAVAFFKNRKAPDGSDYRILRARAWVEGGTWYTYTNALFVNRIVLLSTFSDYASDNEAAIRTYQSALPEYTIRPVIADDSIGAGGAVHCLTQTIPVSR